jgi:VIT1/CCC1 family predicted Fe2+/Mn2+ transporter
MAHSEHNKPKKSGAFFLIILGALLFIITPTWFADKPELGLVLIVAGFAIGGLGLYLRFVRK